jgi:hypothetical protein
MVVAKSGDRDPGRLLQVPLPAPLPGGDDLVVAKSGDRDPGSLLQVLLPALVPGGDDLVVAKSGDRDPGQSPPGSSLLLYLVVMIWLLPRVVTGTLAVSCRFFSAPLPGGDDLVVAKRGDRDPGQSPPGSSLLLYLVVMIWLLPRVVTGTLASLLQVLLSAPSPGGDDLVVAKSGDRDPGQSPSGSSLCSFTWW